MSDFIANTEKQTKDMLLDIGVQGIDELFSDIKPHQRPRSFDLPQGKSEFEVTGYLKNLAAKKNQFRRHAKSHRDLAYFLTATLTPFLYL